MNFFNQNTRIPYIEAYKLIDIVKNKSVDLNSNSLKMLNEVDVEDNPIVMIAELK